MQEWKIEILSRIDSGLTAGRECGIQDLDIKMELFSKQLVILQ